MAHINTFNNQPGATFTDNSLTVNTQQNNTQFNTENQVLQGEKVDCATEPIEKCIHLNHKVGTKVNLFRVIIALQKTGFFVNKAGLQASQIDVFNAFGSMLSEDFSTYQKNLSSAGKHNYDSDVSTKIFDQLKEAYQEYEDKNNQ